MHQWSRREAAQQWVTSADRDRRRLAFPRANASNTKDGSSAIAEAVFRNQAAGYFCDGRDVESWFGAPATEPTSPLRARAPRFRPACIEHLGPRPPFGIVLEDGSQVGVQTTGASLAAALQLDPENPQVTVEGEHLGAKLVSGDEDL